MKILGNRVLLSKITEEKGEGFQTVEVQDSFIYKGKVEQISFESEIRNLHSNIKVGDIVAFAKYSPHTHDLEEMKVVRLEDIIAIL